MGLKTPSFTLKESLTILDEALYLIRTPEQWTTGKWKCPIFAKDDAGRTIRDFASPYGYKPKLDEKGRPMFAYCIEGAVNQAVINKFGPIRAEQVGALKPAACGVGGEFTNDELDTGLPGLMDLLSINDIVTELYADEFSLDKNSERQAMNFNDRATSTNERLRVYDKIINALRTKRQRIARALAQKVGHAV